MFSNLSCIHRKTLIYSFAFTVLMSQPSVAGSIIDMDEVQPLGTIFTNTADDHTYFSLGNGRALLIPVSRKKVKRGLALQDLLLKDAEKIGKRQPAAVKNLSKNLKW